MRDMKQIEGEKKKKKNTSGQVFLSLPHSLSSLFSVRFISRLDDGERISCVCVCFFVTRVVIDWLIEPPPSFPLFPYWARSVRARFPHSMLPVSGGGGTSPPPHWTRLVPPVCIRPTYFLGELAYPSRKDNYLEIVWGPIFAVLVRDVLVVLLSGFLAFSVPFFIRTLSSSFFCLIFFLRSSSSSHRSRVSLSLPLSSLSLSPSPPHPASYLLFFFFTQAVYYCKCVGPPAYVKRVSFSLLLRSSLQSPLYSALNSLFCLFVFKCLSFWLLIFSFYNMRPTKQLFF